MAREAKSESYKDIRSTERKRCFIIGGGYSVKEISETPRLKKKLEKERIIGCNKAPLDFRCDYLIYHDQKFQTNFFELISSFTGEGGVYAPVTCLEGNYPKNVNFFKLISTKQSCDVRQGLYSGGNVGTLAISLAVNLGFKDIFLLGMDCQYPLTKRQAKENGITDKRFITDKAKTHYHSGYSWNKGNTDEGLFGGMIWAFRSVGNFVKKYYKDVTLFNCSELSIIDVDEEYGYKNITIEDALNN